MANRKSEVFPGVLREMVLGAVANGPLPPLPPRPPLPAGAPDPVVVGRDMAKTLADLWGVPASVAVGMKGALKSVADDFSANMVAGSPPPGPLTVAGRLLDGAVTPIVATAVEIRSRFPSTT